MNETSGVVSAIGLSQKSSEKENKCCHNNDILQYECQRECLFVG